MKRLMKRLSNQLNTKSRGGSMSRAFADRYSDDCRQGERDFERNGRPDICRDKYQDENYFGGFEKAKEEQERRDEERRAEERYQEEQEERRQHERAEALRQEEFDREQQEADYYAQQQQPEPEPPPEEKQIKEVINE